MLTDLNSIGQHSAWVADTQAMLREHGYRHTPVFANGSALPYANGQTYTDPADYANAVAIGVVLDGAVLLDYDGNKPGDIMGLDELAAVIGLDEMPQPVQEGSGGKSLHWLFRRPEGVEVTRQSCDGLWSNIDVKTGNQLMHLKPNKVLNDGELPKLQELPPCPPIIVKALTRTTTVPSCQRSNVSLDEAQEIVSYIDPDVPYDSWMRVIAGIQHEFGHTDEAIDLADEWSSKGSKYKGRHEIETKMRSFERGGGITWNTVCDSARQYGADLAAISRRYADPAQHLEALGPDSSPAQIEAAVAALRAYTPIQQERALKTIKARTGVSLGALRAHASDEETPEEAMPIDYARMAIAQYGDGNIVCAGDAVWVYDGNGVWRQEHPEGVKQSIHGVMPLDKLHGGVVESIYKLVKTECFHREATFGQAFEGVNVQNGLLVLHGDRWVLEPHRRDLYLLAQLPVEHDASADCPRFQRFLAEIFEGDEDAEEKAKLVLQLIGYTLLPMSRFEKFALLIGNGANGKSVLLEVLAALLGLDNVAGVPLDRLGDTFKRAHLHGKLANIVTEIEEGAVIADAEVKALTSGELTTAEHKYRSPFSFRPYATLWAATNHMPHTRDFSDALFRRACVLTFNNKFEGPRRDPRLKDALLNELPGILNLALSAIAPILAGGDFAEPASMMQARKDWRLEADQVAQFVDDWCQMRGEVQKGVLYRNYRDWALEVGVQRTYSMKTFSNRLASAGVGDRRDQYARWYVGISPKSGGRA
mgnify:CR=1 FL=1